MVASLSQHGSIVVVVVGSVLGSMATWTCLVILCTNTPLPPPHTKYLPRHSKNFNVHQTSKINYPTHAESKRSTAYTHKHTIFSVQALGQCSATRMQHKRCRTRAKPHPQGKRQTKRKHWGAKRNPKQVHCSTYTWGMCFQGLPSAAK